MQPVAVGEDYLTHPTDFYHERQPGELAVDIPEFWERKDLTEHAKRKILSENTKRFYKME